MHAICTVSQSVFILVTILLNVLYVNLTSHCWLWPCVSDFCVFSSPIYRVKPLSPFCILHPLRVSSPLVVWTVAENTHFALLWSQKINSTGPEKVTQHNFQIIFFLLISVSILETDAGIIHTACWKWQFKEYSIIQRSILFIINPTLTHHQSPTSNPRNYQSLIFLNY